MAVVENENNLFMMNINPQDYFQMILYNIYILNTLTKVSMNTNANIEHVNKLGKTSAMLISRTSRGEVQNLPVYEQIMDYGKTLRNNVNAFFSSIPSTSISEININQRLIYNNLKMLINNPTILNIDSFIAEYNTLIIIVVNKQQTDLTDEVSEIGNPGLLDCIGRVSSNNFLNYLKNNTDRSANITILNPNLYFSCEYVIKCFLQDKFMEYQNQFAEEPTNSQNIENYYNVLNNNQLINRFPVQTSIGQPDNPMDTEESPTSDAVSVTGSDAGSDAGSNNKEAMDEQVNGGTSGGNRNYTKKNYKPIKHKYTKKFITNIINSKKATRKQKSKNKSRK